MQKLNCKNYINNYALNPLSKELTCESKITALAITIILSLATLLFFLAGITIYQKIFLKPTESATQSSLPNIGILSNSPIPHIPVARAPRPSTRRNMRFWSAQKRNFLLNTFPMERRQRILQKLARITKGMAICEQKGLQGKILDVGKPTASEWRNLSGNLLGYWLESAVEGRLAGFPCMRRFNFWNDRGIGDFESWINQEERSAPNSNAPMFRRYDPQGPLPQVAYLTKEQRLAYQVECISGVKGAYLRQNGAIFDTANHSTSFSGKGSAIYVLSPEGLLYAGSHRVDYFHHSSFLAGGAVLAAGEIVTNPEGQITMISDKSGHYKPSRKQMLNILRFFHNCGVNLTHVKIKTFANSNIYFNALEFITLKNPPQYPFEPSNA